MKINQKIVLFQRVACWMSKKNIYRKLNIDREKIPYYINNFCKNNFANFDIEGPLEFKNNQRRYRIITDTREILIDFYYNSDGTTTIQPKVGKNIEDSIKVANHILENLDYKPTNKSMSYSIKLTEEHFRFVIEYFDELDNCKQIVQTRSDKGRYTLFQYRSSIGDSITFKYFDNNTFQVQGKPCYLYSEITSLLAEFFPFEEIVKKQSEYYCVPLNPKEIDNEIRELCPNAYAIFDSYEGKLKTVLTGSLALRKIDIDLPDYSGFVHPALKVLEGYIVILLNKVNIDYNIKDGFNMFYYNEFQNKFYLKAEVQSEDKYTNYYNAIEECYNFYHNNRHPLFHIGEIIVDTRIIETKSKADNIINNIIELIERTYSSLIQSGEYNEVL